MGIKYKNEQGNWNEIIIKQSDTLPIGTIVPFSSDTIPTNWLLCDGSAINRNTYNKLFNIIGTQYGSGDGSTTFNLPNLKGKVAIGKNSSDTDFNELGKTGGNKTSSVSGDGQRNSDTGSSWAYQGLNTSTRTFSIVQPYTTVNYIIKSGDSVGVTGSVSNLYSTSKEDTYSCDYINKFSNYNTDEKVIGEWIDGKPIYRQVVTGSKTHNTSLVSNVDTLIRAYGSGDVGTGVIRNIPYAEVYNGNNFALTVALQNHSINVIALLDGANGSTTSNTKFILEYTKTTD